jgi:HTH-type transcriptional regulator/antitoxin HigA
MKEFSDKIIAHWREIAPLLILRNEREYNAAIKRLNVLLDEIGTNEKHPLYSFLDILGTLIYAYEEERYTISEREFNRASRYVLRKNAKLYKKLSG